MRLGPVAIDTLFCSHVNLFRARLQPESSARFEIVWLFDLFYFKQRAIKLPGTFLSAGWDRNLHMVYALDHTWECSFNDFIRHVQLV
jgi:hypothetical protein